jgi:hypothetical protein
MSYKNASISSIIANVNVSKSKELWYVQNQFRNTTCFLDVAFQPNKFYK